jgi:glycerol-3-phosphate dehydrogenase
VVRKWWDHWIIGTTDTPWDGPLDAPLVEDADIAYLLRNTNRFLRAKLRPSDIVGGYAGLRPLLAPAPAGPAPAGPAAAGSAAAGSAADAATTSALSRDHAVIRGPEGFVTIVGGKYTTYRPMAADAVDAVTAWIGREVPPSPTAGVPLIGVAGLSAARAGVAALADEYGLPATEVERLVSRYGDRTAEVLAPARAERVLALPVAGAPGYLGVEFRYAATAEGAMTLADVLARRTHVSVEVPDGGAGAAPTVARLVGPVLGWTDAERDAQVRAYLAAENIERAALERFRLKA